MAEPLGVALLRLVERYGSQHKLGQLTGVRQSTISTWIGGGRPDRQKLRQFCVKLGLSPEEAGDLFEGAGFSRESALVSDDEEPPGTYPDLVETVAGRLIEEQAARTEAQITELRTDVEELHAKLDRLLRLQEEQRSMPARQWYRREYLTLQELCEEQGKAAPDPRWNRGGRDEMTYETAERHLREHYAEAGLPYPYGEE